MKFDPYYEELPCSLTPAEWADRSAQLSAKVVELKQHQEKVRLEMRAAKMREKELTARIDELSAAVNNRRENRRVEVYEEPDPRRFVIVVRRSDNNEIVGSLERPMTDKEVEESTQGKLWQRGDRREPN